MPIGPYPDFQACLLDQQKNGHDLESAKRICGYLETRAAGAPAGLRTYEIGELDEVNRRFRVLASTTNPVEGDALESWDLSRYAKNNVVLYNHNLDPHFSTLPVGWGEDLVQTERGLEGWVRIAGANENPDAERVWRAIKSKLIRGISVGFDPGTTRTEDRDGQQVKVMSANVLCEISIVPVPLDEDALAAAGEPAEIHPSDAARALARKRHARPEPTLMPAQRADATDVFDRFDTSRLGKVRRTPSGGIRVPANLTRVGVLDYKLPDGSTRRELRLPEEVFAADSIATLEGAPVVPKVFHRALVTPETWKAASIGHASAPKAAGKFLSGELFIQDAATISAIDRGELGELSCGYSCKLDFTPGVWNGQRYDAIQRGIRYNHVALLAPNEGRAGPEVSLRLDSKDAVCAIGDDMKTIRLDGKDYEVGSQEHLDALDGIHAKALAAEQTKTAAVTKELEQIKARFDAADEKLKKLEEEGSEEKMSKRVRSRIRLLTRAMKFLEEDEEKMDALSDRELQERVIKKASPNFDAKDRSDDYIAARFDAICEDLAKSESVSGALGKIQSGLRLDASEQSGAGDVEKARAARDARVRDAWKQPIGAHR